jgi:hypothetical protein
MAPGPGGNDLYEKRLQNSPVHGELPNWPKCGGFAMDKKKPSRNDQDVTMLHLR